jgi:hypothetical protein
MAQYYALACMDCKVFVDLHKFLPSDAWYERFDGSSWDSDFLPGHETYCCLKVTVQQFEQELVAFPLVAYTPAYVRKLVPELLVFCRDHRGHPFFVISDLGDRPWDFPIEGWWEWKEKPVAFDLHSYLPRNLVEDLGVRDWPAAVEALKGHASGYSPPLEATSGDALAFRLGFERALAGQRRTSAQ